MSSEPISFFVPGKAAPGGSKRGFAFRRGNGKLGVSMVDAGKGNAEWKAIVGLTARQAMGNRSPMDGPLVLVVEFIRARPKAHFTSKGEIRSTALMMLQPTTKPDATKLLRALEDGCTPIVWHDDAQVVVQIVTKRYANQGEAPGARVNVRAWFPGFQIVARVAEGEMG